MSTRRLKRLVVAAVCLIFASPAPGTAGSQANDLSANLGFTALVSSPRGSATESLGFEIAAYIVWDATEPVTLELQVAVPEGIRWAGGPPGSADGCISTATRAVCTRAVTPTPGTNLAAAFGEWAVVAERPGSYTFDAKVASKNGPDPDPSNDATSMTVTVAPSAGGVSLRPRYGRRRRRLTRTPQLEQDLAVSPDGRRIAFTLGEPGMTGGVFRHSGIRVLDTEGRQARQLTSGASDHDPAWTKDGTHLLFARAVEAPRRGDSPADAIISARLADAVTRMLVRPRFGDEDGTCETGLTRWPGRDLVIFVHVTACLRDHGGASDQGRRHPRQGDHGA